MASTLRSLLPTPCHLLSEPRFGNPVRMSDFESTFDRENPCSDPPCPSTFASSGSLESIQFAAIVRTISSRMRLCKRSPA